jgi:hypothetical protein
MTRLVKETRRRRTPLLVMALLGVTVGVLIGGGSFSFAATPKPSVANYQQCSDNPGAKNVCGGGWINGIINTGGSQYAENDATAQRLVIDIPTGAKAGLDHTFTLRYLWNKGNNHAYDSLVKWNTTISGLDASGVCAGVTGTCPAAGANFNSGNGQDQAPIPNSSCTASNGVSGSGHVGVNGPSGTLAGFGIASRDMVSFNTTALSVDTPVNDSNTCSLTADEYETVTVHFSVASLPARVMFLFAGHLACGTNRTGCWGSGSADTNGASNINGGPYHIKVDTIDGASAGSQDNQIMSGAIAPLTVSNLSTSPGGTATTVPATWSATAHDGATVTGSAPTGTVTFKLYGPFTSAPGSTSCVDSGTGANLLWTSSAIDITTGTSSNSGNTWAVDSGTAAPTGGIGSSSTNGAGIYQWVVSYSGDPNNSDSASLCGDTTEQETFTASSTTDAAASPTP